MHLQNQQGGLDQIPGAGSSDRWAKSQGTWSGKTKKKVRRLMKNAEEAAAGADTRPGRKERR